MTLYSKFVLRPRPAPRLQLQNLKPAGLGTAQVESLSSYLTRLATAHWLTPTNLYSELSNRSAGGSARCLTHASRLDGYSKLSGEVASVLNHFSPIREDFHRLTLTTWKKVFAAHGAGLLRKNIGWCLGCYAEDSASQRPPFNRLLWSMTCVSCCPVHGSALNFECDQCGARQPAVTANADVGFCQQCGTHFAEANSIENSRSSLELENLWKSQACAELVRATQKGLEFSRETFLIRFEEFLQRFRGSPKTMAKELNMQVDSIRSWVTRGHLPEFRCFLEFCYRIDVPPVYFFLETAALPLHSPRAKRKTPMRREPEMTVEEMLAAGKKIRSFLQSETSVQTVQQVADSAKISARKFQYRFPDEYRDAVGKIFERRAQEKRERDAIRISNLHEVTKSLVRRNIYPSQRRVLESPRIKSSDIRLPQVKLVLRQIQDNYLENHPELKADTVFMHRIRVGGRQIPTEEALQDQTRRYRADGRLR